MGKMIGNGDWASDLCRAFGENPKEVKSIKLFVASGEVVTVKIEKFVNDDNTVIIETIKKVAWVEDDEQKGTSNESERRTDQGTSGQDTQAD
jgi:hypothetical protein